MPRTLLTALLMGALSGCAGEPAAPQPEPEAPDVSAADELIARSIAYHDPAGLWDSGEIALRIMESRPNGVTRTVEVGMAPGSGAVEVRRETDAASVSFAVSGDEILRRAVDGFRRTGCDAVSLTVTASNKRAVQLYERAGFRTLASFPAFVWHRA